MTKHTIFSFFFWLCFFERLQILACGFIKSLVVDHCWLVQLFSLACTIRGYAKREYAVRRLGSWGSIAPSGNIAKPRSLLMLRHQELNEVK